jgi:F-type H+-transporting ATPase subunit gamma
MATIRQIRRRIRSVSSTAKITKAMELVAASKMRRAQMRALAARPYADKLRGMLADLAESLASLQVGTLHPLLERREVRDVAIILITPDRGLCGGLNANLNRRAAAFALEQRGARVRLVCVGRKGRDFFTRAGYPILGEFTKLGDYPSHEDTRPIARLVMDDYVAGVVDQVFLIYPLFINTVTQRPEVRQLLPAELPPREAHRLVEYIYEPSRPEVLGELLPRYVEMTVYEAVLELSASEQSARMVAMRSATDAAYEMIQELTLTYNKVRQEQITKELLDIVGGSVGLEA